MNTQLINIGNSQGIRIPKGIINKYGFNKGVVLVEEKECLKLLPVRKTLRQGWQEFYSKNTNNLDVDWDLLECGIDDDIE